MNKDNSLQRANANRLIHDLEESNLLLECPCCAETHAIEEFGLFFDEDFTQAAKKIYNNKAAELATRRAELRGRRDEMHRVSRICAEAVNHGSIIERIAPCLPSFPFERGDCRSMFDPVDYIIFEGLHRGSVDRIIFLELKTGKSRLNKRQQELERQVSSGKVEMKFYALPAVGSSE